MNGLVLFTKQTTNEDLKKVYQNVANPYDRGWRANVRAFLCVPRRASKIIATEDPEDLRLEPPSRRGAADGGGAGGGGRNDNGHARSDDPEDDAAVVARVLQEDEERGWRHPRDSYVVQNSGADSMRGRGVGV